MAILDSINGRFDESIKADKVNTLNALIFASSNISRYKLKTRDGNERSRSDKLIVRTIEAFDLYRLEGRNSYGGEVLEDAIVYLSGDFDDAQKEPLKKKFQKNYQDGGALGIWYDTSLNLSPLAKRVANHEITISRYLSIVFLNIFSYRTEGNDVVYFHVLETLLDYLIESGKTMIDFDKFFEIYFHFHDDRDNHRNVQARALAQYLCGTEYFVMQENYSLAVDPRWIGKLSLLKSFCNHTYKNLPFHEAEKMFDNRTNRDKYADVLGDNRYEKEIARVCEGLDDGGAVFEKERVAELPLPKQVIFSGAPGTGKSYQLNKLANQYFTNGAKTYYQRVTFHPNMNYGHFVGVYKPVPSGDKDAPITYKFVPGVLLQQLVAAFKNPNDNYLVLIEEINRANTAMVFGDMFQLLDRTQGVSDYPVSISEDIAAYLISQGVLGDNAVIEDIIKNKLVNEGLYFPKNLYIWASMNEADQGVMPMDTAFKRRWSFEKFDIDSLGVDGEAFFADKVIATCNGDVNWNQLRMAINGKLLALNIPEGKLLGPYFISKEDLLDKTKATRAFETKVLMYLCEDVAKARLSFLFNIKESEKYYGAIRNKFKTNGVGVFADLQLEDSLLTEETEAEL